MPKISLVHEMTASQEAVWNAWADFGNIADFHPGLKRSAIIKGPETGPGATRVCEQHDGTKVNERITIFEPQSRISWLLESPPNPLKAGTVTVSLMSVGPERTRVQMDFDITMGVGPFGPVIYHLAAKNVIKKNLTEVLVALDEYLGG